MKIESLREEYMLSALAVDQIAEQVESFLYAIGAERANMLRIRLSLEEALLRWLDRFGEETEVVFSTGSRRRRPIITLELKGDQFDPLTDPESVIGPWAENMLTELDLNPHYSYQRGVNILQLRLRRPQRNPAVNLLIAIAIGLALGLAGLALPDSAQTVLSRTLLTPLQDLFFRILNAASGPVIFFSVLTAICGFGSVAVGEKNGRKMLIRFIILSTVLTVISMLVSMNVFSINYHGVILDGTQFTSVLDVFLHFMPGDVLSPIIAGESPQIILMAVILGYALLTSETKAEGLVPLVQQLNSVGMVLAEWVGKIAPFFVVVLLILGLWNRSLQFVLGCWKPLVLFLILTAIAIFVCMLWVSVRKKVSLSKLMRKTWPSFLVALRTSSVDAAYGDNVVCCEKRLGISKKLTSYSLPLGLVIYMPAGTIATMIFSMYTAKSYGLSAGPIWCIVAVIITVALLVATPPMTGIGLLAYSAIFARLGIPSSGLTIALLADVLFGFVTAAANQVMLQLDLVLQADRMGELNTTILRK